MQYLFHPQASAPSLELRGDEHRYIFKVRRHREGEEIALRNLQDNQIHLYTISYLDKKQALLTLNSSKVLEVKAKKSLHIAWCVIDPKSIEKMLPTLNEIGIEKITFIYCRRSQKSFRVDFKRLEKILLNSSQQCGRSQLMELEMMNSLEEFLKAYPQTVMLNFSKNILSKESCIETIAIGCEGGFTEEEIALFEPEKIIGLDSPLILKSESAVCAVGAKLLL